MDIPLLDEGEVPLPPDQVRFRSLTAEPYPDRQRVRIRLSLTPFLERPNIEIELRDPQGAESGSVTVVESVEASLSMTVHLRDAPQSGEYRAVATLGYPDHGQIDSTTAVFRLPVEGAD